ncbi:poly(A) polymerase [Entomortierella parvispora]|uniref:polynucleotide adenylyltransferase n=1 Tax=Entomortierella parvispora TaxID=205924 RepID=A0A9P3HGK7_9FUNG|nr:poly(A) polymerase [Entomortierella parvispora]
MTPAQYLPQRPCNWNELPYEIAALISDQLFPSHRAACVLVSKAWHQLWTPQLWQIVTLVLDKQTERFAQLETQAALEHHGHHIRRYTARDSSRMYGFLLGPTAKSCTQLSELILNFTSPYTGRDATQTISLQSATAMLSNFEIVAAILERNPGLQRISLSGYFDGKTTTGDGRVPESLQEQDILEKLPYQRLEFLHLNATRWLSKGVGKYHEESTVKKPEFKELKHLVLSGIYTGVYSSSRINILRLLPRCINLQILEVSQLSKIYIDPLLTVLQQCCPHLRELTWHDNEDVSDEVIAQVLSFSSCGWKKLYFPLFVNFGPLSCKALMGHAETLEVLDSEGLRGLNGEPIQRFLENAKVLRHFRGAIYTRRFVFSEDVVIDASQILDLSNPNFVGERKAWACAESLESLQVLITGIPRWDVLYRREGQPLFLDLEDRAKAGSDQLERRVYSQLGKMTKLKKLLLGHPEALQGNTWDMDDIRDQIEEELHRSIVVRPFQHWCLSFSLDAGLELLRDLKELSVLDALLLHSFLNSSLLSLQRNPSHHTSLLDMNPPTRQLGITPSISDAFPTPEDLERTESLEKTLREQGLFESEEESRRREIVLGKLDKLVKEFVYLVSIKRNQGEAIAREAGGKIFTFGSYRLGVHGSGSDIDTLCVVPKIVEREDFFEVMYDLLRQRPEVTELAAVPDAFTPVITMKFSDIPIDLTFARLGLNIIHESLDLSDDSLLRNLDDRCIRSVNGSRVTDDILRLVPSIPSFRLALRCVKLWAQRRAIYSNMMGFLGGVAWAMLVARVCQLYPNACASTIVVKFFAIVQSWPWPQPVMLKPIEEGPLQVRVWNPKLYQADKAHKMPIITPAYPSMCSTHNVTDSTKAVMFSEFKKASDIVNKIIIEHAPWSLLFAKDDFFTSYNHYLQVIVSSDTEERHLRWSGLVESRIRHLVSKLERVENLVLAHPYIKGFDKVIHYRTAVEKDDAAHGVIRQPATEEADGMDDSQEPKTMYTSTFYVGLSIPPREPGTKTQRQLALATPKNEFVALVKTWDQYDEQTMSVIVKHIRSHDLPLDVIDEADRKKSKRAKSKKADEAKAPNKKRRGSVVQNGIQSDETSATSAGTPETPSTAMSSPFLKSDASAANTPVLPQA